MKEPRWRRRGFSLFSLNRFKRIFTALGSTRWPGSGQKVFLVDRQAILINCLVVTILLGMLIASRMWRSDE
jgi:hypothetical protein